MTDRSGVTLIELLIVLVIFTVVMAGLYAAYSVLLRQGVQQYRLAESAMELQIAKSVLERDIAMAGFGIADDYGGLFTPKTVSATDGTPDTLTLLGTALGTKNRASQAWSWVSAPPPTDTSHYNNNAPWPDGRENLRTGDWIIYIEANTKRLLTASGPNSKTERTWLFPYPGSGSSPHPDPLEPGAVVFGLQSGTTDSAEKATQPFYAVQYNWGGSNPSLCDPETRSLLRAVSRKNPAPAGGYPLLTCVLGFQVAFGLDVNEDGLIDCWDNGGTEAANYPNETLRTRLKQVRAYILVQTGKRDRAYTYANQANPGNPETIRVGDSLLTACGGGGVGEDITLSDEQRRYRWRVIAVSVMPRNVR